MWFVFGAVLVVVCSQSLGQQTGLPAGIVPPYVLGVEHFNDTLKSFISYKEGENLKEFFSAVFGSVKNSHESFSKSKQVATTEHEKLSQQQASVQSQIDSQRANLQKKIAEKASKQQQLTAQTAALQQSERHVANAEQNLRNLQHAVNEAQKKVDEARHCLHRRRKRGFGSIFKEVRRTVKKVRKEVKRGGRKIDKEVIRKIAKPIERTICAAVNELTGNLRDKKRLKEQAERDAANYRNTVNQARKAVTNTQAAITTLTKEIQAAQSSITSLNGQIAKLGAEQKKIIQIKEKISHVDSLLSAVVNRMGTSVDAVKTSQAALLIAEIEDVVDFENAVQPLVEAGQLISGSSPGVVVPKLLQLSPAAKQKISENLLLLQNKLNYLQGKYGENSNLFQSLDSE